mmetsp:Transcript_17508/g.44802  ORF Transcript_17508/g.44802 Transcript_17508/m.44802 type:complete len:233 (-) Transcript_17508:84-782(-)
MDLMAVRFVISEQEYGSTNGTVRDMLTDRGFRPRPITLVLPRKTYGLDGYGLDGRAARRPPVQVSPIKPAVLNRARPDEEAIRMRVAKKLEEIATETRAEYRGRLDNVLVNGIFSEATNLTRMSSMYKSDLVSRISIPIWEQLEREALHEVLSGHPIQQSVISRTDSDKLGAKLDRVVCHRSTAHALESTGGYQRIIRRQTQAHSSLARARTEPEPLPRLSSQRASRLETLS